MGNTGKSALIWPRPPAWPCPPTAQVIQREARTLSLRFDRTHTTASRVAAQVMEQVDVADFSLTEPDLASIIKQIYNGALN